jgi:hypothetical protein
VTQLEKVWYTIQIKPQLHNVFMLYCYICSYYYFLGGEDQLTLLTILGLLDNGCSPVCDITVFEVFLFLEVTIQMGHDICYNLEDYWPITEALFSPLYGKTVKYNRYLHILGFLNFQTMTLL